MIVVSVLYWLNLMKVWQSRVPEFASVLALCMEIKFYAGGGAFMSEFDNLRTSCFTM